MEHTGRINTSLYDDLFYGGFRGHKEFHSDKDYVHGSRSDWLCFNHLFCVLSRGCMAKVFIAFHDHGYIAHRQQWRTTLANHNL